MFLFFSAFGARLCLHSFPTRRSSDLARRWAFKHPTPADLFRTLEDASGEDLDWFWRGWFYSIEACDIAIDTVKLFKADLENRSEEHTSELQSQSNLVCRLLLEKKKQR